MQICAYTECGVEFEPKTHNQRYHTPECCKEATNIRIMDKYYERKERRQGNIRTCITPGCGTQLSRYNDDKVCGKCDSVKESERREFLLRLFNESR